MLILRNAGPDPALAIRLHRAAKEMGLNEQFGVGTDSVGTDEIDNSDESAPSAPSAPSETTNCGKIDAEETEERGDTTGVNTPFHFEQKKQNCRTNRKANRKASIMWALLMARIFEVIFEVMPLSCPHCGQAMKIISFIMQKTVIQKILGHLGLTYPQALCVFSLQLYLEL